MWNDKKIIIIIQCKNIYNKSIKGKISVKDFFMMLDSKLKVENLMNLVM